MHERTLHDPVRLALMLALAMALAVSAVMGPVPVRAAVATGQKVVVIVGPVGGGSIQTNYLNRGETIADAAEALGATVVRVFSPNATYANVRAAVNGANIIVYIGHGSGYPNPYSSTLQPAWNNGWGLNAIAGVDAYDPTGHGHTIGGSHPSMLYCGEAVLEGKPKPSAVPSAQWCAGGGITPAPGFVMVFSNACYAPGAGETEQTTPSSEAVARMRVEYYSRPYLALGGTYFASDLGARSVVENVLGNPHLSYGDIYAMGSGYSESAQVHFPHSRSAGDEAWLQRTSGPGGLMSYWYAFAGDPNEAPQPTAPIVDFTASPTAGIEQLWVGFDNDTVTSGATTWAWDFTTDGTVDSTERNPSWVYPTAGTYTVTLTATNPLGTNTLTKSNFVTVTAPQPTTYVPVTPTRLLDTRSGNGLNGRFNANIPRTFQVAGRGGVPVGATAVTGNLTVTNQSNPGFVYLGPSPIKYPPTSALNFPQGDSRANGVTLALGPGGTLSATFAPSGSTDLVFDVTGYFVPNTTGSTYVPLEPSRVLDTRDGTGLDGPFSAGAPRTFAVGGTGGVPADAVAVAANLTVTQQTVAGYLYLGPSPTANPASSTLNFPVGDNRANNVILALGSGGTLSATYVASSGTAHVILDVTGYFVAGTAGARFVPLTPSRLLDTRFGNGLSGMFTEYSPRTFQVVGRGGVPAAAVGVTGNLTVTAQTKTGAVYVGPIATANPPTSTLNFPTGDSRANGVTVALGAGGTLSPTYMTSWGTGATHLIFDVTGYFKP